MAQVKFGRPGNYNAIRVVVGDCAPESSLAVQTALLERGIPRVTVCDGTESLYRALDAQLVDLLIYDYHLLGPRFIEVMQRIRRGEVGQNPFLTIVATVRDSSIDIVRRSIDAGVDDLFRAPAAGSRLVTSINKSLFRRKPFTATYDYVGPVRPLARRERLLESAQIRVPNTLAARVIEGADEDEVRRQVEGAAQRMNMRRIQFCGAEIDRLAHTVTDGYGSVHMDNGTLRGTLERLGAVADDLRRRALGTPSEYIADLAVMLVSIGQRILAAPIGRAVVEVQLLSQLATAVRRALTVEAEAAPAIREIADAVSTFIGGPPARQGLAPA